MLDSLKPKKVFDFFKKISEIPRCSGHEEQIANFIEQFAKDRNLDFYRDEYNNVVVRKSATKGKESSPVTILQGHIDMVCVKESGYEHDFSKDALKLYVEDGFLKAKSTTLGADNGIAVAYMLAILDSDDIEHPALEAVFTTDEEVGMTGALNLDKSVLKGKYFINVDSEEEGIITVGCAGGNRSIIELPFEKVVASDNSDTFELCVSGVKGGHSGVEIHKNRVNANVMVGRILNELYLQNEFNLVSVNGGTKDNVICFESKAILNIGKDVEQKVQANFANIVKNIEAEVGQEDKNIKIVLKKVEKKAEQLDRTVTKKAIYILNVAPNGVVSMSNKLEGMVETSLNLGVLTTGENSIVFNYAIRSNVASKKIDLINKIRLVGEAINANFRVNSDYPEWEFKPESRLLDIAKSVYKDFSGKEAEVQAIHAGLEPGVFLKEMPEVEAISIGPDMFDVHSPDERLDIGSAKRMYDYVLQLLKQI